MPVLAPRQTSWENVFLGQTSLARRVLSTRVGKKTEVGDGF